MKYALLLFIIFLISSLSLAGQKSVPAIVIHGGAGTIERGMMTDSAEAEIRAALRAALDIGYSTMENGGSALEAVAAAIGMLEDAPQFNAGRGAVMTSDGRHELDASVMDGSNLNAGAVAGVTTIKNPIRAAMAVMENSTHVLLSGEGAETFARGQGLEHVENDYFTVPRIKKKYDVMNKDRGQLTPAENEASKFGTVGAVAVDKDGNIAAGTSTGGMMNKQFGRIGDSPLIGAGTYADNATCGVSCTGHGEYFIRIGVAKDVADQMEYGGKTLEEAARHTIHGKLTDMKAGGGLIALDRDGNISMEFNTSGMYRGFKNEQESKVEIYKEE